ncbi:Mitochondrial import inner membrane translocase subunit tim54 [Elsinoe australis]|uniref:Mitochondrial import inner membrane translocase subunit TIM54 n=1 Tax=Elsinoe australis TaxID=40998 RepID=A0A2P7YNI1_9PEZI|nr:Mitochondrial import inner membrane translocase subunit tim54 [Elsinoe australis]
MSDPASASGASPSPAAGTNTSINSPSGSGAAASAAEAAPKQNPALKAMGIPNFRFRLPSRNWMIFLTVTGSFTAAVMYDRREKRKIQQKWEDLVSPLRDEIVPTNQVTRRIKVYVQAPPGDGLTPARELFYEYIKPILVAGGMDWEVVEGRREGDVRWGVAEGIRKERRKRGEGMQEEEDVIGMARERGGTKEWEGIGGELVVGRHTWKEYVRGLHEGWLGPVEKPEVTAEKVSELVEDVKEEKPGDGHAHSSVGDAAVETLKDVVESASESSTQSSEEKESKPEEKEKTEEEKAEEERKKRYKPDPYNSISDYATASLPRSIPEQLGPTTIIPFTHLIGFTYTPRRVWYFLNRRKTADEIGKEVAAIVLAAQYRSFDAQTQSTAVDTDDSPSSGGPMDEWRERRVWEQEKLLAHEEPQWHKIVRKREKVEGKEDVWKDPMTLDERIAGRMRVFELSREDEDKAERIAKGELKMKKQYEEED